jgi:hypothetical protein
MRQDDRRPARLAPLEADDLSYSERAHMFASAEAARVERLLPRMRLRIGPSQDLYWQRFHPDAIMEDHLDQLPGKALA